MPLLQAVWQYCKKTVEILKSLGFVRGSIDPCLCIVYVALYVDDNLMIGDIATIDDAIEVLTNRGWS